MASDTPQPTSGFGERFFRYFQHEATALQEQMSRLPSTSPFERVDAITHCLGGISRLSNEVQDASQHLPAYDQRTYAEAVKALNEKLQTIRDGLAPKPKFSFRGQLKTRGRGTAAKTVTAVTECRESAGAEKALEDAGDAERSAEEGVLIRINEGLRQERGTIQRPSFADAAQLSLFDQTGIRVVLQPFSVPAESSSVLRNLNSCVVDLSPTSSSFAPLSGLTLKDISRSIIVCGVVSGPIHITNVKESILVVACRQFRMHECKDVDVYLHCGSNPIVEDVESVNFTPLPDEYLDETSKQIKNMWDQVDDFKWLKNEPSPHWKLLPDSKRVDGSVWTRTLNDEHLTVEGVLFAAGMRFSS